MVILSVAYLMLTLGIRSHGSIKMYRFGARLGEAFRGAGKNDCAERTQLNEEIIEKAENLPFDNIYVGALNQDDPSALDELTKILEMSQPSYWASRVTPGLPSLIRFDISKLSSFFMRIRRNVKYLVRFKIQSMNSQVDGFDEVKSVIESYLISSASQANEVMDSAIKPYELESVKIMLHSIADAIEHPKYYLSQNNLNCDGFRLLDSYLCGIDTLQALGEVDHQEAKFLRGNMLSQVFGYDLNEFIRS